MINFKDHRTWIYITLGLLFFLALGIRLVDLTDPPLDFHPTRQFRGALIARSIYYQIEPSPDPGIQEVALSGVEDFQDLEPPILESLVAATYFVFGEEQLWVARVYSSIFWLVGGLVLFFLVKRMTSSFAGLVSVAYYLFLPFAVYASRSFQPDPFMVMWVIFTLFAAHRWAEEQEWKWGIATALFGGMAVLTKAAAAFLVGGVMAALILPMLVKREKVNIKQVAVMGVVMVAIPGIYYFILAGESSSSFFQGSLVEMAPAILEPDFWVGWYKRVNINIGQWYVLAGMAGIIFAQKPFRRMLAGLWVGYFLYGLAFPHHISTHSYYHIQFVPVVALSFGFVIHWLWGKLVKERPEKVRLALEIILLAGLVVSLFSPMLEVYGTLRREDYRSLPEHWAYIGSQIPEDGKVIGLVPQYGHLLKYYGWKDIKLWPSTQDLDVAEQRGGDIQTDFETYFLKKTQGMDYFLITQMKQFEKQEDLAQYLTANYIVINEGNGYIIFDLRE